MVVQIASIQARELYTPTVEEYNEYANTHPDRWETTVKYGYYTLYFFAAGTFFAVAFNVCHKILHYRRFVSVAVNVSPVKSGRKAQVYALLRWLAYSYIPPSVNKYIAPVYTTGSFAQTFTLFGGFLFCTMYCFAITYYYRPPLYGSSPLGLRSEWIAMAMLPFIFAFAQKRNLIGTISGTSYEKLQVLHQGVSILHFYMSLVHTFSMIIWGFREDAGVSYLIFYSGFGALGPLIWLSLLSMPFIRQKTYEAFWFLHIAAAIAYLVTLWYHVWPYLDSSAYMYTTFAVCGWGLGLRIVFLIYRNLRAHTAELTLSSSGAVLINIPTSMRWSPGQHAILRFYRVRPLESHPYSISSLPSPFTSPSASETPNTLSFVVAPQSGFSAALARSVAKAGGKRTLGVLVDGPFGESAPEFRAFDAVLLVAGGSGIAHILPIFLDLVACMRGESEVRSRCARVELVWSVRELETMHWYEQVLLDACRGLPSSAVSVHVFVTGHSPHPKSPDSSKGETKSMSPSIVDKESTPVELGLLSSRPPVLELVTARGREWAGRVGVAVCGPDGLARDTGNAVAGVQIDILQGRAACEEMYLQTELFSY
ncbi:ferric reductase NAD binding domain-containing protein [Amylostereum chailletii]|nr:ferric reductase NAD binding domain-containing protein [Amylostereum chailletii]